MAPPQFNKEHYTKYEVKQMRNISKTQLELAKKATETYKEYLNQIGLELFYDYEYGRFFVAPASHGDVIYVNDGETVSNERMDEITSAGAFDMIPVAEFTSHEYKFKA